MISELFIILLFLSISIIFLGAFIKSYSLSVVGFVFLGFIGLAFLVTGISFEMGTNETYIYGNNFSGVHWDNNYPTYPTLSNESFLFHRDTTKFYQVSSFSNSNWWGILLILLSVAGCIVTTKYKEEYD